MFVFHIRTGRRQWHAQDLRTGGGAMTVISLQKQPGTVEGDGSRRAVRPFWRPQVYQPATRIAEPLLRRRAGWVPQLRGEILLQIRCRWHAARLTIQSVIAQPDSCGSSRTGCPVHRVRLEVCSGEVGRESPIGWIGAVRPSRCRLRRLLRTRGASRRTQDGDAALRLNFLPSLDSIRLVGITGLTR